MKSVDIWIKDRQIGRWKDGQTDVKKDIDRTILLVLLSKYIKIDLSLCLYKI